MSEPNPTAQYRLVHFVPDPYSGTRIPLAALLVEGERLQVVYAPDLLPDAAIGGRQGAALAKMIQQALRRVESFERLPREAGPHARLDASHPVPPRIADPEAWLQAMLSPRQEERAAG